MVRLEKDVEVETRFVAFVFLKNSGNDGSREAGLAGNERVRFGWQNAGVGFVRCRMLCSSDFAAADRHHVRSQRHADGRRKPVQAESADRKPASRIEQVARIVAN